MSAPTTLGTILIVALGCVAANVRGAYAGTALGIISLAVAKVELPEGAFLAVPAAQLADPVLVEEWGERRGSGGVP